MKSYGEVFVVLILAWCTARAAGDTSVKEAVKGKVAEINNAIIKENFGKVADLTHPKLVEKMGGRKKMISVMESGIQDMKSKGFEFRSVKVDTPSEPVKSGSDLFIIASFTLEMKVPGGRVHQKSFVIGISTDQGKTWSFVNGDLDIKTVKQILPDLPEQLKLPERQKPVFEKE